MNKMKNYIPDDIPKEILEYETRVKQLGVGKSGKVGILELELQGDINGKTIVTKQFSQVPLQIQRALYPESSIPNMAYLYLISPSGGILQGDRYRTDLELRNNSICHFTTQGATRIYSMNANLASQIFNITLKDSSYLEFIPDQIIPFRDSRYYQKVNISLDKNSSLIYSEVLTPGRVAMDESFEYDICYFKTQCLDQEKKVIFLENTKIEPKKQRLSNFGIFGKNTVVATVYLLTKKEKIPEIELAINVEIKKFNQLFIGISILPRDAGLIIRVLGNETENIFRVIFRVLEIARNKILGKTFTKIRKN